MNSDDFRDASDSQARQEPREALIDALLSEHARLDGGSDEAMLEAIRARTVDRPVATRIVELTPQESQPHPRQAVSPREWLKIAAVVALSLAGLGFLLSQSQVSKAPASASRTEQTFQLVSHPAPSVLIAASEGASNSASRLFPLEAPNTLVGEVSVPQLGSATSPSLEASDSFPRIAAADPVSDELLAEFSVSAERLLRLPSDRLVYEGNVLLKHPDFTLEADRLEISAPAEGSKVGTFVAEGENLTIEKVLPSGTTEVAHGTTATWEADGGGSIILAGGPPTLNVGNSFVSPQSRHGYIVLRNNGYQVIER